MITTPQIKAARALLDWTQADLAKASGLHLNVINNIERGTNKNPRQGTLEKLQAAFEGHGIVLIGSRGVELRRDTITMLKHEGDHFIATLTADILASAHGEVLSILADIRNFAVADNADYLAGKDAKGLREKLITRDIPGFYPRHSENYRLVAPEALGPVDTIIYGDTVAYIFWPQKEVAILKNADLAATQRQMFTRLWESGHEPVRTSRAAND